VNYKKPRCTPVFGGIEQTVQEVANLSRSIERQVVTSFRASNLTKERFCRCCYPQSELYSERVAGLRRYRYRLEWKHFRGQ
jgi:hypothetical protein